MQGVFPALIAKLLQLQFFLLSSAALLGSVIMLSALATFQPDENSFWLRHRSGAETGIRTRDLSLTMGMLYQLSYLGSVVLGEGFEPPKA